MNTKPAVASVSAATQQQKQALLHKAVLSKLIHWAAMAALEALYKPSNEVSDRESNKLVDALDDLASGYPGSADTPNPDCIDDEQVAHVDKVFIGSPASTDPAQKKQVLHTAVLTKVAYWENMLALEQLYKPSTDVTDNENDELYGLVDTLAENYPGDVVNPQPDSVTEDHTKLMDNIFTA